MIKIENVEVLGWEAAIRGMRNPKNSWDKSDSEKCHPLTNCFYECNKGECEVKDHFHIGPNDHELMMKLRNAGTDHRKFMRMIDVYLDITAPLYWWKEFDTYKVGTVANSCSTMHKIHAKEFTIADFSHEHLIDDNRYGHLAEKYNRCLKDTIETLNCARQAYLEIKRDLYLEREKALNMNTSEPMADIKKLQETQKLYWWQMIQLLPSSYNQKRTVKLNYEVLANIYKSRRGHKLDEWQYFCKWIESLPYSELIIGEEK